MKSSRSGRAVVVETNIFHLAASLFSHLVQQKTVYRAADAKSKHARVWMLLYFRDDLHIVADVSVRHKTHNPHMVLCIRRIQRSLDGLHHLGTAVSGARSKERLCFL